MAYSEEAVGRGVFTTADLPTGTIIEVAPGILVPRPDYEVHVRHTVFEHYTYTVPGGAQLLALGFGSLYNHRDPPNVSFKVDARTGSTRRQGRPRSEAASPNQSPGGDNGAAAEAHSHDDVGGGEETMCVTYTTCRPIVAGEELLIYYGARLWFEDRLASPSVSSGGAATSPFAESNWFDGFDL